MRGQGTRPNGKVEGDIDEAFWARAAAEKAAGPSDESESRVHMFQQTQLITRW